MKIVIAGATGVAGATAVAHFAERPDWDVVSVSRRTPWHTPAGVTHINADLDDTEQCRALFAPMTDITHLLYAAVNENPTDIVAGWADQAQAATNVRMLENLLRPIISNASKFRQVALVHGMKAYGSHVPRPSHVFPFRETDPPFGDSFYHQQQAYVSAAQVGQPWSWTIIRPGGIAGVAIGGNMNWLLALGAFAALCKDAGLALPIPAGNSAISEFTDSQLIAECAQWAFETPAAANQVFNLTNGDVFALHNVFPILAEVFDLKLGEQRSFDLSAGLQELSPRWPSLVEKHGLISPPNLDALLGATSQIVGAWSADWPRELTVMSGLTSTIKLRKAGFQGCIDSGEMIRKWLIKYQELKILP